MGEGKWGTNIFLLQHRCFPVCQGIFHVNSTPKTSQCPSSSTPVGKALAVVISFFCEKARGVRQSGDATLEILGKIMNHN